MILSPTRYSRWTPSYQSNITYCKSAIDGRDEKNGKKPCCRHISREKNSASERLCKQNPWFLVFIIFYRIGNITVVDSNSFYIIFFFSSTKQAPISSIWSSICLHLLFGAYSSTICYFTCICIGSSRKYAASALYQSKIEKSFSFHLMWIGFYRFFRFICFCWYANESALPL